MRRYKTMSLIVSITGFVFAFAGLGCSPASDKETQITTSSTEQEKSGKTDSGAQPSNQKSKEKRELHPEEFGGGTDSYQAGAYSLCHLVDEADRLGGLYRVTDIVQYPYKHPGKTFVHIERISGWGSNPVGDVRLSYNVGPTGNGGWSKLGPAPEVKRGEKLVLLFEELKNTLRFRSEQAFRNQGQGWTNGHLFRNSPVSLSVLRDKIMRLHRSLKAGNGCPFDVKPDDDGGSREESDSGQVDLGTKELEKDTAP